MENYKITGTQALLRYYKAKGYFKYVDEINEQIGRAADQAQRELWFSAPDDKLTTEVIDFLKFYYAENLFEFYAGDPEPDVETGEIIRQLRISW